MLTTRSGKIAATDLGAYVAGGRVRARVEAEKRQVKRDARRARDMLRGAWKSLTEEERERRKHFADSHHEQKEREQYRFYHGAERGDVRVGGRYFPLVKVAPGFASRSSPVLGFFVSTLPKRGRIRAGMSKHRPLKWNSKIFALDEAYVAGNKAFPAWMRVDLDGNFASIEVLLWMIRDCGIEVPPNIVVCETPRDGGGQVVRPHVIWMLPPGSAVWHAPGDRRCRRAPVALIRDVAAALVEALLPLGADPGGLANLHHAKNPLSPHWTTYTPNEQYMPTLSEWAMQLDLGATRAGLVRQAAAGAAGLVLAESNAIFDSLQQRVYALLRGWAAAGNPDYLTALDDRKALGDLVEAALAPEVAVAFDKPKSALKLLDGVAQYAAKAWNPELAQGPGRELGAMSGTLDGLTLPEKQAAAGRRSGGMNALGSINACIVAVRALEARGEAVSKAAVAREADLDRRTVSKHWGVVQKVLALAPNAALEEAQGGHFGVWIRRTTARRAKRCRRRPRATPLRPTPRRPKVCRRSAWRPSTRPSPLRTASPLPAPRPSPLRFSAFARVETRRARPRPPPALPRHPSPFTAPPRLPLLARVSTPPRPPRRASPRDRPSSPSPRG